MSSSSVTQSNMTSPLVDMAAVVRVHILRAALISSEPVVIKGDVVKVKAPRSGQLLATCRLICKEALPILYGENTFEYNFNGASRPGNDFGYKLRFGYNTKLIKTIEGRYAVDAQSLRLFRLHTGLKKLTIHYSTTASKPFPHNDDFFLSFIGYILAKDIIDSGPVLSELKYLNDNVSLNSFDFKCNFRVRNTEKVLIRSTVSIL